MANWSNPTLTSLYTNFVTEVKDRDTDLAVGFDGVTATNLPTGTIRWNSSINRWQKWSGTAWGELAATYALTTITATGTITGTALIPSASTVPTNGLYLPSANTLGFATASTGRAFITPTGQLLIGTGSSFGSAGSVLQVRGSGNDVIAVRGDDFTGISIQSYRTSSSDHAILDMIAARGTGASPSAVLNQDILGTFRCIGWDGSSSVIASAILGFVDGTPSPGIVPGSLEFHTRSTGGTITARVRILNDGQVCVGGFSQNTSTGRIHAINTSKAWVNFNGTGTVAIRASYNVSSITDTGIGSYGINLTANVADANYSAVCTCSTDGSTASYVNLTGTTGGASGAGFSIVTFNSSAAAVDRTTISAVVYD